MGRRELELPAYSQMIAMSYDIIRNLVLDLSFDNPYSC